MNKATREERKKLRRQKREERYRLRQHRKADRRKRRAAWAKAHRNALRRARAVSYHLLALMAIAGITLLGFCRVPGACLRFWEGVRDLCLSFSGSDCVTTLPHDITAGFPQAIEELRVIAVNFGTLFISKENFFSYLALLGNLLVNVCYTLTYALLPGALLIALAVHSTQRRNRDYGKKSKPLAAFLCIRQHLLLPIGGYIKGFWRFFRRRKKYFVTSILIALFFLNVYTIALEALAYYFFILLSDTLTLGLGSQVVKLIFDVFTAFRYLPAWVWVLIAIKLFDMVRKEIGYKRLEKTEADLRKFLEERGVNILICGAPRMGKTTTLVSIVRSLMAMAHKSAKQGMRDLDRKFPDFPWIILERMIRKDYARGVFRNLCHLSEWLDVMIEKGHSGGAGWIRTLRKRYRSCSAVPFRYPFFNYDTAHFKTVYYGGLGEETIEEAVRDYAALYLIYIQPMLILANFSIRADDDFIDLGNFPEWRDDFFRHEPDPLKKSRYAKILNQDLLRPGKQVDPKCKYKDCFEFGVIAETEVGKERGNQFNHAGKSSLSAEANVLNDKRDDLFKLMGHLGTIYNLRFAFYVGDEQRASSWSANAMELCDVLTIRSRGKDKILMPFFGVEELIYLAIHKFYGSYYDDIRRNRGDITLTTYLFSHLSKAVEDHYDYIKNKFGGHFLKVNVLLAMKQDGDRDAASKGKIFISSAKVYSHVFRTAAWKGFMEKRAERSELGLEDVPEYKSLDAGFEEFMEQRSYFFTQLVKTFDNREGQESALEFVLRTVDELYKAVATQVGAKRTDELLGGFCSKLPQIAKEENFEKMKEKLNKERENVFLAARKEMLEKEAKKAKEPAEEGKDKAKRPAAAGS